jgi:hypothetical protein
MYYFVGEFQAFSSSADVSFWKELARRKINEYKLNDDPKVTAPCRLYVATLRNSFLNPKAIQGFYSTPSHHDSPSRFIVSSDSFLTNPDTGSLLQNSQQHPSHAVVPGTLHNVNTSEAYHLFCTDSISGTFQTCKKLPTVLAFLVQLKISRK